MTPKGESRKEGVREKRKEMKKEETQEVGLYKQYDSVR